MACCSLLEPAQGATLIDLGGATGAFFADNRDIVEDLKLNVIVADIHENNLKKAAANGFKTIFLNEQGFNQFGDKEFDIVFCNSVLEHVTVKTKIDVWSCLDQSFFQEAFENQKLFSAAIERISKQYFVQTPHVGFPIESHTWTPAVYSYPKSREVHVHRLEKIRKFWRKYIQPDFNLLDEEQVRTLFPQATKVYTNFVLSFPKEIIAYRA